MPLRIIPRLDIKGPNLVKGIHLEGLRVLGKPEAYAKRYYDDGADELIYMDTVASLLGRNSLLDIIERTAREVFIPLCVGGGIRSKDDIRKVLRAGADKVSMNTAALARPEFVSEAARDFGSSTIVVAIEAIRQADGTHLCFTNCGREHTGVEAIAWAKQVEALGAGEILVTSVDREGTGKGFDLDLTRAVAESVSVPVIAHGGAGAAADVTEVVRSGLADAVAVASLLHYDAVRSMPFDPADYVGEGNTEFLLKRRKDGFARVRDCGIAEIKQQLAAAGFAPREEQFR